MTSMVSVFLVFADLIQLDNICPLIFFLAYSMYLNTRVITARLLWMNNVNRDKYNTYLFS